MMNIQEVMLKAMAGKLKWWEAAEIIGVMELYDAALAGALPGAWLQRLWTTASAARAQSA